MLLQSAVAVERDMVGKDSDGLLIGGVVELRNNCSCALLAASNAAAADCASAFDLGAEEKNCTILLGLPEFVLNRLPPFSVGGEKDGQGVEGELLRKGFDCRRGMASRVRGRDPVKKMYGSVRRLLEDANVCLCGVVLSTKLKCLPPGMYYY